MEKCSEKSKKPSSVFTNLESMPFFSGLSLDGPVISLLKLKVANAVSDSKQWRWMEASGL
jgi:hypothetical protein